MNATQKKLLDEIRALNFAALETALYLDGYPNDKEALAYFQKMRNESQEKMAAYEATYGPLTFMGARANDSWEWVETPWPWESED